MSIETKSNTNYVKPSKTRDEIYFKNLVRFSITVGSKIFRNNGNLCFKILSILVY